MITTTQHVLAAILTRYGVAPTAKTLAPFMRAHGYTAGIQRVIGAKPYNVWVHDSCADPYQAIGRMGKSLDHCEPVPELIEAWGVRDAPHDLRKLPRFVKAATLFEVCRSNWTPNPTNRRGIPAKLRGLGYVAAGTHKPNAGARNPHAWTIWRRPDIEPRPYDPADFAITADEALAFLELAYPQSGPYDYVGPMDDIDDLI